MSKKRQPTKKKSFKETGPVTSITQGSKHFKAIKGKTSINFSGQIYQLDDCEFLHLCGDVREIDFTRNSLTVFNGDEYGLTKLKVLNLNENLLRTCSFGGMGSLDTLLINDNRIKGLSNLDSLTKLQTLELRNNELIDFSELSKLRNLRTLDLSANGIDYTPSEFVDNVLIYLQGLSKLSSVSFRLNPAEQNISNFFHFLVFHLPKIKVIDLIEVTKDDILKAKTLNDTKIWDDDSPQVKKIKKKNENSKVKKVDLFSDVPVGNSSSGSGEADMSSLEDLLKQELSLETITNKKLKRSGKDKDIIQKENLFGLDSLNDMLDSFNEPKVRKQILPTHLITGSQSSNRIKISSSSNDSDSESSGNFEKVISGMTEKNRFAGTLRGNDKNDEMSRLLEEIGLDHSSGSEKVKTLKSQLSEDSSSELSKVLKSMSSDFINSNTKKSQKNQKYKGNGSSSDLEDLLNDLNALTSGYPTTRDDSIDDILNDLKDLSTTKNVRKEDTSSSETLDSILNNLGSFKFSKGEKKSSSSSADIDNMLNDLDLISNADVKQIPDKKFKSSASSEKLDFGMNLNILMSEQKRGKSSSGTSSENISAKSQPAIVIDSSLDFDKYLNDLEEKSSSKNALVPRNMSTPIIKISGPSFGNELKDLLADIGMRTNDGKITISKSSSSSSSGSIPLPTKKNPLSDVDFDNLMNDLEMDTEISDKNTANTSRATPENIESSDALDDLMSDLGVSFGLENTSNSEGKKQAVPSEDTEIMERHNQAVLNFEKSLDALGISSDSDSMIDLNVSKVSKKSSGSSDDFDFVNNLSALMNNTSNTPNTKKPVPNDEELGVPLPGNLSNQHSGMDLNNEDDVDVPMPRSSNIQNLNVDQNGKNDTTLDIQAGDIESNDLLERPNTRNLSSQKNSGESLNEWNHNIKEINIKKSISEGVFGVSYLGTISEKIVRAKKLYLQIAQLDLAKREISNFLEMNHPNIVSLIGSKDKQYAIQPFIRGRDLNQFLLEENDITPQFKLLLARELAKSILYLHNEGIVHGSLKPANIIIDDDHKLWVMDYGFMFIKEGLPTNSNQAEYIAPEFYSKTYGIKLDSYSFGVILFELFSDKKAFEGMTTYQIIQSTINGTRPDIPDHFPEALEKVVNSCWYGDEDKRPDFMTIMKILDLPDSKLLGDYENNSQTSSSRVREHVNVHAPKELSYGLSENEIRKVELLIEVLLQKLNSNSPPNEIRGLEAIVDLTTDPLYGALFNRRDDILKAMLKPLLRTGKIGQFDTVERVLMGLNIIVRRSTMNTGLVRVGIITSIVSILASGYDLPGQITIFCVQILGEISKTSEFIKEEISLSGGIFPFMVLLDDPNKFIQVAAVIALSEILDNARNLSNFKVAGGFSKLVRLFQNEISEHLKNPLQIAICNFLGDPQGIQVTQILELLDTILKQLQSREPSLIELSVACLSKYAKHNAITNERQKTVILKKLLEIMATALNTAQSEYEITITRLAAETATYFTNSYESLVIARDLGILTSTVQLLSSTDIDEVAIPCLDILSNFIQDDQSREALINLGLITNFVHLVDNPNSLLRSSALQTLGMLLERSLIVKPVLSSGIIEVLISISTFSRDDKEIMKCLQILENLCSEEILSRHICYSGAVTGLAKRLDSPTPDVVSASLSVFLRISKDEIARAVIVQEGIFPKFISLLRQVSPEDQGIITWILSNFGLSDMDKDVVVKYQVIRCCLALLRSEHHPVVLGSLRGLLAFSRFPIYIQTILQEDPELDTLKSLFDYPDPQIQTVSHTLVRNISST